jgi:hypothetical protein
VNFLIADTFTDSLARLTGEEQKAVKTTAFDLQMSFHKLEKAKDRNFWSVRVSRDIRLIVHRTRSSLLLCYVGHHDPAYAWAERRKLETHPKTGAAQMVEIRVPVYVPTETSAPLRQDAIQMPLFASAPDDQLLGYGVPAEWLAEVRKVTEGSLLALTEHLPAEAAEALVEIATGGAPRATMAPAAIIPLSDVTESEFAFLLEDEPGRDLESVEADPFKHPDAQRRFRTIENPEELQRALEFPWDKWTIFLHPEQRLLVEREQSGPARVSGSAGTGKTIVALHRAVHLAKQYPNARVLLATYSEPLAHALGVRLRRLISNDPRLGERIDVGAIAAVGARLYRSLVGPLKLASREAVVEAVKASAAAVGDRPFTLTFLLSEWDQVADAWQIQDWPGYRDVARLGRKTRLREDRRQALWSIFEGVQARLAQANVVTEAGMFSQLAAALATSKNLPYDCAVVDEAQDISVSQLRFFAALGGARANALFFAGDLGQRIFQTPFSWKTLGVDIRGRARTLRINYRTSHQIRAQADQLLESDFSDADGNTETRGDAISVFNGLPPVVRTFADREGEMEAVGAWLAERIKESVAPHEIGVFVRSDAEIARARVAVEAAGLPYKVLDERVEAVSGFAAVGTMHLAKGLEFRAVVVMACDDEIIPLQSRIETVGEDADLRKSTTPNGNCCTSRARGRGTF